MEPERDINTDIKKIPNSSDNDTEESVNTVNTETNYTMNEETSTNQVPIQDKTINEYLNGIKTFLKKMESLQTGGGNSVVTNERKKIAKLFNVLSVETLLNNLKNEESFRQNSSASEPSQQE